MNLGRAASLDWLERVVLPLAPVLSRLAFFACLPYPVLPEAARLLAGSGISAGAQNVWPEGGSVTGEVSAHLLAECGCRHVMCGHAERRRLFGEDDGLVAAKAGAARSAGLVPVVCVGESEHVPPVRAAHETAAQLAPLKGVPGPVVVLYEPAWAIGADEAAPPAHAAEVLRALRRTRPDTETRFLYGGAVLPGTFTALRTEGDWDGVAVGRAAQDRARLAEVAAEILDGVRAKGR
jgi:triosephosphate isomerase